MSAPTYDEIIRKVIDVANRIPVQTVEADGRIGSAIGEKPFLEQLKRELPPTWDVVISPPRAACDILINGIRTNLKITVGGTDNVPSKPSFFWSITGDSNYPYASNWNTFLRKLTEAKAAGKIKVERDPFTEYHYLVKHKTTGAVIMKSIFDIHHYVSNASNDLQINWANEFEHAEYVCPNYSQKVAELLAAIQRSVQQMIANTTEFATADLASLVLA